MGRPGNQYYIPLDAETYASWGVDMLKIDCCYTSSASPTGIYNLRCFFFSSKDVLDFWSFIFMQIHVPVLTGLYGYSTQRPV